MQEATTLNTPFVSLILVTYNSVALLDAFFEALASTTYAPYEVIVVDNASHDGTVERIRTFGTPVTLIANADNRGFGRACNQGADVAQGDFLVFLNPDVLVTPAWLTLLVDHISLHPDAAIICPTTLYPDQQIAFSQVATVEEAAVPGCAMMVRRTAWRVLGGFDEQIFMYWEDTELCWRAWLLGWRVLADLQAYVYHERGGSTHGRAWDAEHIQHGLYTYLKLMRWRRILPFTLATAAKTVFKLWQRRTGLLRAWGWNIAHLPMTLRQRHGIREQRRGQPSLLEHRIAQHARRLRRERRERRSGAYDHQSVSAEGRPDGAATNGER